MAFDTHSLLAFSLVQGGGVVNSTTGTTLLVVPGAQTYFAINQNVTVWPPGVDPTLTNAEIMRITNIVGNTLTVLRGQETSTALKNIVSGYQIANTITPKVLTDIESGGLLTASAFSATSGSGNTVIMQGSPTITTPTIVENLNPVMTLNGNPVWQYLNSATYTGGTVTSTGSTPTLVTNLTVNVTIPSGCTAVRITIDANRIYPQTGSANVFFSIFSGATTGALTTQIGGTTANSAPDATAYNSPAHATTIIKSPSSGSIWYSAAISASSSNAQVPTGATFPAFILVECC